MNDITVTAEPAATLVVDLVLPAVVTLEPASLVTVNSAKAFQVKAVVNLTQVTVDSRTLDIIKPSVSLVSVAAQGPLGATGPRGLKGDQGETGQTGAAGQSGGLGLVTTAAEAMGGHRAFVLDANGQTLYADCNNILHFGRVGGITLNAVSQGGTVSCVRNGLVNEPSWAWLPNLPVYLGRSGLLTQVLPSIGFSQVLGVALSNTALFVNPREPIFTL